jgi:diguanylate cyclase (GGDEF)-like protein
MNPEIALPCPPDGRARPCSVEQEQAIRAALGRPFWQRRFPPPFEAAYSAVRAPARATGLFAANLLGYLSFWLVTRNDLQRLPEWAGLLVHWRGLLMAAMAANLLLLVLQALGRASLPNRTLEMASGAVLLMVSCYGLVVAQQSSNLASANNSGSMVLIFMFSGLVLRQQFPYALAISLMTLLGYAFLAARPGGLQGLVVLGNLRLLGTALVFTLVANYLLELMDRRYFLLRRLEATRRDALSASADVLRQWSERDALTGLANRRHFDAELAAIHRAAMAREGSISLLMVDIDHFKAYNDHYGHPAGDLCLQQIADLLRQKAQRYGGLAARLGGEEFALLLPDAGPAQATERAAGFCNAVRRLALPHAASPLSSHVSVSVGAATLDASHCASPAQLLQAADAALYQAKRTGRDRYCCAPKGGATSAAAVQPAHVLGQTRATGSHHTAQNGPVLDVQGPGDSPMQAGPADAVEATSAAEWATIHRLNGLLVRGPGRLTFPPDLEADFGQTGARARRWQLFGLGLGGLVYLLGFLAWSRPLFPDIADAMYETLLKFTAWLILPMLCSLLAPMSWRLREAIFAIASATIGVGLVLLVRPSQVITVHSYALSLTLIPMFCAVVATLKFRFTLATSLSIFAATTAFLYPQAAADRAIWLDCTQIQAIALLFSMIAGYRMEFSARRNFLLKRLEQARRQALVHSNAHLEQLALTDALTGLPNRRQFEAEHQRAWDACKADRQALALLIIDIDHFKLYNDGYGHPAGDACLQQVGKGLQQWMAAHATKAAQPPATGKTPLAARLGGEEFAILLPACGLSQAQVVADRIGAHLKSLAIEHRFSPVAQQVTVSIGVASVQPAETAELRALLKGADMALYRAKSRGRDRVAA